MEGPPANECCSICHDNYNVPCQANCSHWFCGNCIMLVWQHGSAMHPCKCPLCRREITLLVPAEASLRQRYDPAVDDIVGKVETYNRFFGGHSAGVVERLQDLPFLLRRLFREMTDPQRTLPLVIKMFMSAIYIISPVDIIPEAVLGVVGLLDDLIIALICFLHVAAIYRSFLQSRHGGSQ